MLLSIAIATSVGGCDRLWNIDQLHAVDASSDAVQVDAAAPLERYYVQSRTTAYAAATIIKVSTLMGNVSAGDLLLVAVCAVASNPVASVSDTAHSTYVDVAPAAVANLQSNLFVTAVPTSAAGFTVDVTFSGTGAVNPDVRIAEYQHLVVPPVTAAASQTAALAHEVSVTLPSVTAPALLFAANCVGSYTEDIPGYTRREQSNVNGDRISDLDADTGGSYTATTIANGSNAVIMTLVSVAAQP